jgi:hypothetical protein
MTWPSVRRLKLKAGNRQVRSVKMTMPTIKVAVRKVRRIYFEVLLNTKPFLFEDVNNTLNKLCEPDCVRENPLHLQKHLDGNEQSSALLQLFVNYGLVVCMDPIMWSEFYPLDQAALIALRADILDSYQTLRKSGGETSNLPSRVAG